jgi:deoxyribodipyrimidine photo-lyase
MADTEKTTSNSLMIFRRDLRLHDNNALNAALESSKLVIPIIIYDTTLLENPNRSENAIQFMQESIFALKNQLEKEGKKLYLFKGKPWKIITNLVKNPELNISSIFINRDYTPYSQRRDDLISKATSAKNIKLRIFSDLLLNEPESVLKKDGTPYTVFTPYYKRAVENLITIPQKIESYNFYSDVIETEVGLKKNADSPNIRLHTKGGRKEGTKILSEIHKFQNYELERDLPAKQGTTFLSAHLHFGTVSIRETYHLIKDQGIFPLLRQLYWRDFYHYIGFYFPHVFNRPFRKKYDSLNWSRNENHFELWCKGKTGFPIVDAGMKQLNTTGFMHNRVRMIVASFLTKDLHINWQWGERYFAKQLTDYDKSVNNGNWQWSSSTGCDPVPYFRIFNPWRQQKKFDPQCEYIKKYIPELRELSPKAIHNLEKTKPKGLNYPRPIVDHSMARKQAIMMFKKIQDF